MIFWFNLNEIQSFKSEIFCKHTVSGEIPQEPVVSKQSGHVYEKRLIQKYLQENDGKCPVTNNLLMDDDLISLQGINIWNRSLCVMILLFYFQCLLNVFKINDITNLQYSQ